MSFFDIILTILTIIGSLGIFLYGMILMSEALQKVAGIRMRKVLSSVTSNDFKGVLTGLTITGALQSSSATTVMIVSFVNAGLISLRRSISLIMGANIGTTVTAWIIVLLGFGKTFNISVAILPLVALGLPLLFSGKSHLRSWAEFIIGFSILFLGLQFLKSSIPVFDETHAFVQGFQDLVHFGYFSVLLFVGIGVLLTIIFQSSSAVMALTIVIAIDGWIGFDMAAAMVLGENLGTTITANIAALVANRPAKRSALFHVFFNVAGAIWVLLLFTPILQATDSLSVLVSGSSPLTDYSAIPLGLAVFHTGFNILNTLIFFAILPYTESLLKKVLPEGKKRDREKSRLKHLGSSYLSTSELSIVQARKEIKTMSDLVIRMFDMVPELMMEREEERYEKIFKKIRKYEKITDKIDVEINMYLTKVSESKLSHRGTEQVRNMLKIVDNMESIGDAVRSMSISIYNKNKEGIYFVQEIRDNLHTMFELVRNALLIMAANIDSDEPEIDFALELENKINELRNNLRKEHIESLRVGKYNHRTGMVYTDLIHQCEHIGDSAINISESLT
jgi:phosphate:Na+ symporter